MDIKNGRTVKGVCFEQIKDAGDPVALAKIYAATGADELVFLDITATIEKRKTLLQLVEKVAAGINIPFTVGGGISTVEEAKAVVHAGADKISINSSAVKNEMLISSIAAQLGSQCVVVAIDARLVNGQWNVFINGGRTDTGMPVTGWALRAEALGAGEILLTSMNNDGVQDGFAIGLNKEVSAAVRIPVIASGGAGRREHFFEVFTQTTVSAALAASVFHFGHIAIPELKQYLKTQNIAIR